MSLKLSVVFPTRNRPDDMGKAIASILTQQRLPDQIIVVDQSSDEKTRLITETALTGVPLKLTYIHDPTIAGLVAAKQVGTIQAIGDLVLFLEDDVVIEPEYLAEMERGFRDHPTMLGCCGVVTNMPKLPALYGVLFHLFHRGIFRDPRVGIYGLADHYSIGLIPSRALSGGLSAWRREIFSSIEFDVANEFHMLEDIDFSTRAESYFGSRFFINPKARLAHYMSPVNRDRLGTRQRRKVREFLTFYKKRRAIPGALVALVWLLCGLCFEAIVQSVGARSFRPLSGALLGLIDGIRRPLRKVQ